MYLSQRLRINKTDFVTTLVVTSGPREEIVASVDVFATRRPDSMRCIASLEPQRSSLRKMRGHGHCESLAVAHEQRRNGFARQLLRRSEDMVASWGYEWMTLQVEIGNNAARQLYISSGYEVWDCRRRPLRIWRPPVELLGKQIA